jgi:hypothetical protein
MRVPKSFVPVVAQEIIEGLCGKKLAGLKASKEDVIKQTEEIILEELAAEDRLNREVRELLRKYDTEIEKGRLDYRKLFDLTKQKLVKERNIIL